MKKKIKITLVIILCIIFFSSIIFLLQIMMRYRIADKLYEESVFKFTEETDKEGPAEDAEEDREGVPLKVDFTALQRVNSDVVGWIYCEGTEINYPVVQGEDNDFYLHRTYDGTENSAGSIFVEALNARNFADSNTIIYGHHMKNGSMFATLRNWADQEYYEEHPVFWLLTPKRNYQIKLFSGYTTPATSDTYTIFQGPCQELNDYLQMAQANSDFSADVETDPNGKYVVLSTCEYDYTNARYVLHGMLVPFDED